MAKLRTPALAATMNVNRRTLDEEHRIEVVIKLDVGRTITAELSAEQFMLALTGRSEMPVELHLRNVDIVPTGKGGAEKGVAREHATGQNDTATRPQHQLKRGNG